MGLAVAMLGVTLMTGAGLSSRPEVGAGDALSLAAGLFGDFFLLVLRPPGERLSPLLALSVDTFPPRLANRD